MSQACPFCESLHCEGEQAQRHWRWWATHEERRTGVRPTTFDDLIERYGGAS